MSAMLLVLLLGAGGRDVSPAALVSETRPLMGTLVQVTISGAEPERARAAIAAAFTVFGRCDEVMNEWRPESPLSALNAAAGSGSWVSIPADLCRVLAAGLSGARRTGGLFDPTWAALRGVWRFGGQGPGEIPAAEKIAALCPLVDHRKVEIEGRGSAGGCRARLSEPGMQVGLGGLAKGWAVAEAARTLRGRGVRNFFLQAGGDLYAAGLDRGRPWRVGVRNPRGAPGEILGELEVRDRAFSTSGDYEHFFVVQGVRYHHIIDPRTCRPAAASRSVSIVARSAVDAEILGKAAFILGGEAALDLAREWGAAAVVVTAAGQVLVSPELSGSFRLGPPVP